LNDDNVASLKEDRRFVFLAEERAVGKCYVLNLAIGEYPRDRNIELARFLKRTPGRDNQSVQSKPARDREIVSAGPLDITAQVENAL